MAAPMTGPRDQNAASSRADARRNRDRILETGAALLAANPQASLGDIAQAANVSRATVYRHFPDLDSLRAALVEEAHERGRDLLRERIPPMLGTAAGPIVGEMLDLVRTALGLEHRWTKMKAGEPDPNADFVAAFAPVGRAVIKRGQARGEFRADLDIDLTCEALIAIVMFAVRKVHADGVSPDLALEPVRLLLDGMAPSSRR